MSVRAGEMKARDLEGRLEAAGMGGGAARDRAQTLSDVLRALVGMGVPEDAEAQVHWVPGRIEVLGKHTDYAGGRSLLAATQRGFWFAAVPSGGPRIHIVDAAGQHQSSFQLSPDIAPPVGHWSNYPMTVARRLARNFAQAEEGARIAFGSDLPQASGMSSSSAMITGFFLALSGVNSLQKTAAYACEISSIEDLAGYLGTIENGQSFGGLAGDKGVGTFGGSEDHTAILTCRSGSLNQYAYCPVRFERRVPMPEGHAFVIGISGVVAEKTGAAMAKYNRASQLAVTAARAWRNQTASKAPHLAAALEETGGEPGPVRNALRRSSRSEFPADDLVDRFDQFYEENQVIVPAAGDALGRGDLAEFGRLVDRSQQLATDLLKNQVEETVYLARSARELGAAAASAFGAGFGGSVWALVAQDDAEDLRIRWSEAYASAFPQWASRADCFATGAGQGVFEL